MAFTVSFKEEIVRRILNDGSWGASTRISKEINVSTITIRRWLKVYKERNESNVQLANKSKVCAFLNTLNLPFEEKSRYCRMNGILIEELSEWEDEMKNALSKGAVSQLEYDKLRKERDELKRELFAKEKDLRKKDKALAEAASLLLLEKKLRSLVEGEG